MEYGMKNEYRRLVKIITGLILIAATLLLFANPFFAGNAIAAKIVTVIIEETTEDSFISDTGEFRITEQTEVINKEGEASDIRYLSFPVKVKLLYEESNSPMPHALKIQVIETLRRKPLRDPNLPE